MSNELERRPDYTPARRGSDANGSTVRRIMNLRGEALIDRAKIAAEVSSALFQAEQRMDAAFDLAEHMTERSASLGQAIVETGNDRELHQLHSYIKGAATEAIITLMQGAVPDPASDARETGKGR
jgi:hypothetical protein